MDGLYVSNLLAEGLLQFANRSQLDKNNDFGKLLRAQLSEDPTHLIPYEYFAKFYAYCIEQSKDPLFGLHQGESYNMAALGIVGQIIQVSTNVQEGIEKCIQHFNLISNVLQIQVNYQVDSFTLFFIPSSEAGKAFPQATQHMILSSMLFAYHEIHFLTLKKEKPSQVSFVFDAIKNDVFNRVFNCNVQLAGNENSMTFTTALLERKIIYADFELLQVLEAVACARIKAQTPTKNTFTAKISVLIYTLLNPEIPSFNTVAENLNMSTRNLQRKLQQEDTSYSKIVETVKKDLALDYLKKDLSIKEVSYLMGYSEPGTFVNAFKKWFGETPGRFKAAL